MKVVVYILCHDEQSSRVAAGTFGGQPWARVLVMPDTPPFNKCMEGAAYLHVLEGRREEWADADFVGTLSWRALDKIRLPDVEAMCAHVAGADAIALYPSAEPLLGQAAGCHPRFMDVWVPMLTSIGYDPGDAVSTEIPAFFCNYWLATPEWMDSYIAFAHAAFEALETLPDIQDALWAQATPDANKLTPDRAMQVYGVPHVPLHAYIFERLPCFFFWKHDAVLVMAC